MKNTKLEICEKCWGTGHVHGGDENSTWSKSCEDCHGVGFIRVPMTNADRIRAMTDEELIAFFVLEDKCPPERYSSRACDGHDSCKDCWIDWLQQPAKGDA